jgi:hypothetical protein
MLKRGKPAGLPLFVVRGLRGKAALFLSELQEMPTSA